MAQPPPPSEQSPLPADAGTEGGHPPSPAEGRKGRASDADLYDFHAPQALTTIDSTGRRKWVYPAAIHGFFMRWRRALGYFVIVVFLVTPWIKIGGMQAILLQIPERQFILFGKIFWPQEVFYLVFLLIGLALALFFFTALMGRVWCGWLCPQTVFMEEIFRRIEEWVEGGHHQRQRLDSAPWSVEKVAKKVIKHALFLLFSALVSNTFIAYFVGTERLLVWMTRSPFEHWTAFLFMASIMGIFYWDFAWFREQFCVVVCPYARFQSVLTDAHTVQVGYDLVRGEPRGHLGSTEGDCIDCYKCVAVCPTGIDIRDGYQLECIGCARCIDACDSIMERLDRPRGLIRYDSLARLAGEAVHIFRPRVLIYSGLLLAITVALFVGLGGRPSLDLTVVRPPGEPFSILPGGMISNQFTVRLHNRSAQTVRYKVAVIEPPGATLIMPVNPLPVGGNEQIRTEVFVNIPQTAIKAGKVDVRLQVFAVDQPLAEKSVTFLAPAIP